MGNNKFSIASVGNRRAFRDGARDGVPIALGYFAVSFSLGIVARNELCHEPENGSGYAVFPQASHGI